MQFIPSTWSVVGVDGDGDGKRNPQDIDDAALATAVYLCSGDEDLSTPPASGSAVYRYNHSQDYVDLVLSIMAAYAEGDYSSVPTSSAGTDHLHPRLRRLGDGLRDHRLPPPRAHPAALGSDPRRVHPVRRRHARHRGRPPARPGPPPDGSGGSAGSGSLTAQAPSSPASKPPAPVTQTLSALDKAKQTCQNSFTAAQISALGGLTACGNAVLDQGLSAVTSLLNPPADGRRHDRGGTTTPPAPAALTRAEATAQCLASGDQPARRRRAQRVRRPPDGRLTRAPADARPGARAGQSRPATSAAQ